MCEEPQLIHLPLFNVKTITQSRLSELQQIMGEEGILTGIGFLYKITKMGVIYDLRHNPLKNPSDESFPKHFIQGNYRFSWSWMNPSPEYRLKCQITTWSSEYVLFKKKKNQSK